MLDNETKRRIDTARDILVGKVPDPKSQVEQITIALIYKFMDDMDKESIEFGGNATFFTGEYEKYGWSKIFDPRLGGYEMLALYSEAIEKLDQNPNIPQLFRDIFKNAYLPYRDPETLKLFLKTINEFTYEHSEKLGDAYEYLLSVLGSQGDAGQFRTPRHIIDFIVNILQPKKNETILDPACGTAGFLISSYKYILKTNLGNGLSKSAESSNQLQSAVQTLTPAERKKLMEHFTGYDISPDMVRMSLVNMYLHNFTSPKIYEYDTLTSEDRWGETFDIIMANPPFMTPKGGIKPHKKFSMQANRSEVLFVDYIMEHINPTTGRAGVIVPEGIIFQSATAYKSLRKLLVDKHYLYAVVSLPAGVFNPYSGVKTSVLLMDKTIARKTDKILFVKVEHDGYDLGAQRKPIDKTDLPKAAEIINLYKEAIQNNETFNCTDTNVLVVEKERIKANADYNLSVDRYKVNGNARNAKHEMIRLGNIAELEYGFTDSASEKGDVRFVRITDINEEGFLKETDKMFIKLNDESKKYLLNANDLLVARTGATFGKTLIYTEDYPSVFASYLIRIKFKENKVVPKFYWAFTKTEQYWKQANELVSGGGQPQFNANAIKEIVFPLPPLSIQQEIVNKIEGWQRIIDGAKQVVENYKPQIDIDPEWEMVKLGEVCEFVQYGLSDKSNTDKIGYRCFRMNELIEGLCIDNDNMKCANISEKEFKKYKLEAGDILFNRTNSFAHVGRTAIFKLRGDYCFASYLIRLKINDQKALPELINHFMNTESFQTGIKQFATKAIGQSNINAQSLQEYFIPLPLLSIQERIVNQIEQEQQLINANKELIKIFEQKIKDEINKLWESEGREKEEVAYKEKEMIIAVAEE